MRRLFLLFLSALFLSPFAVMGCSSEEDCDCPSAEGAAPDDTAADDADDSAPVLCTEGELLCNSESDIPEECVSGEWIARDPCPQYTYCNFGRCEETLIDLPRDESPHQALIEWWYFTGNLRDAQGNLYGFELTFFYGGRAFGLPAWMINVAFVDVSLDAHEEDVRLDLRQADENPDELHLQSGDASVDRTQPDVYELAASTRNYSFDLTLHDEKGATFHGRNGSIRMSSRTVDSFYYSRMRMSVTGTIERDGAPVEVEGEAWMDHQWGNFIPFMLVGWDWFSMRFDDDTELMFFVFRADEHDPSSIDMASGTYVDANGDQSPVLLDDVEITPLSSWTSPTTGGVYPQDWNFRVDRLDLDVDVISELPDQEMPNIMWNYWEGLVGIGGVKEGRDVTGRGFVELSGYAGRPFLWFLFDEWY